MPFEKYERPRGINLGVRRTFEQVAVPWLETGKRALDAQEAEIVVLVCHYPHALAIPILDYHRKFASLVDRAPGDVGDLMLRVAKWREKQRRTKTGRARSVIEIALTRYRSEELSSTMLYDIAKAEKIDLSKVSPDYLRGRVDEVRREVKEEEEDARARMATVAEISQLIAKQNVQRKALPRSQAKRSKRI